MFDGSKPGAWTEHDDPSPLNVYGRSKLAGEQEIEGSGCNYLLLRTSWIYAARGSKSTSVGE
ncbi:MAG: sugar nucleotide-binding protein [Lysobacteraceae bacterium]